MSDIDVALKCRFRIVVYSDVGEPKTPAVSHLADLLRQRRLSASGLADEKAYAVPLEAIEHRGAGLMARQRSQARNLAMNIRHKLAA